MHKSNPYDLEKGYSNETIHERDPSAGRHTYDIKYGTMDSPEYMDHETKEGFIERNNTGDRL